jgi:hypothetical protein
MYLATVQCVQVVWAKASAQVSSGVQTQDSPTLPWALCQGQVGQTEGPGGEQGKHATPKRSTNTQRM